MEKLVKKYARDMKSAYTRDRQEAIAGFEEKCGKEGIPHLIKALGDTHTPVIKDAIEALAKKGDHTAVKPLLEVLDYEFESRTSLPYHALEMYSAAKRAINELVSRENLVMLIEEHGNATSEEKREFICQLLSKLDNRSK